MWGKHTHTVKRLFTQRIWGMMLRDKTRPLMHPVFSMLQSFGNNTEFIFMNAIFINTCILLQFYVWKAAGDLYVQRGHWGLQKRVGWGRTSGSLGWITNSSLRRNPKPDKILKKSGQWRDRLFAVMWDNIDRGRKRSPYCHKQWCDRHNVCHTTTSQVGNRRDMWAEAARNTWSPTERK